MKVIEPKSKLVRAGSILQENAFRDSENLYFVVLDMQENYFNISIRPHVKLDYDAMWVFNVQTGTLGIFDEDEMVEPVELTVNVERKEA